MLSLTQRHPLAHYHHQVDAELRQKANSTDRKYRQVKREEVKIEMVKIKVTGNI